MAFANLENLFNEKVNKLYAGAKNKYDNGRASNGRTDEPYLVRNPGSNQAGIKIEGRGFPRVSAAQDVKRLTLFQISRRGLLFLAKQQLLQTGNTFEHTRLLNPTFVVANAIPFLHRKRQLKPFFGSQSKDINSLRKIGQLQQETYNKITGAINLKTLINKIPVVGSVVSAFTAKRSMGDGVNGITFKNSRPELSNIGILGVLRLLTGIKADTVRSGYAMAVDRFQLYKKSQREGTTISQYYGPQVLGEYTTYLVSTTTQKEWKFNPSEATDYQLPLTVLVDPENTRSSRTDIIRTDTTKPTDHKNRLLMIDRFNNSFAQDNFKDPPIDEYAPPLSEKPSYVKYFKGAAGSVLDFDGESTNARDLARAARQLSGIQKISYMKDTDANVTSSVENPDQPKIYNRLPAIDKTNGKGGFDDPITVSFAMGNDSHVQFRAFIKNLIQTADPEYKTYQYIGRIEKFISYVSAQRKISFTLDVLAFSPEELSQVWTRINYLTGLVYPYGYNKGLLQPNIARLTIGSVYKDQPGYITSLTTDFSQPAQSWDIDSDVPIGASMNIQFTLIEKTTKIATSPFYGIVEDAIIA